MKKNTRGSFPLRRETVRQLQLIDQITGGDISSIVGGLPTSCTGSQLTQ